MTSTPQEPISDPQVVPSGDPAPHPVAPGQVPEPRLPETEPEPV